MKSTPAHSSIISITAALALAALPALSSAQVLTLAGFEVYPADSSGTDSGGDYVYIDNSSTTAYATMTVTEGSTSESTGIDLPLSLGVNNLTFTNPYYADTDTSYAGLGLFFTSASGGSFNPAPGSTDGSPELSAFSTYGGSGVSTPASGTLLADYANGPYNRDAYSGATSYTVDGHTVSVTGLSFAGDGGTLQLTVTPEPSSLALCVVGLGLGLLVFLVRARRA